MLPSIAVAILLRSFVSRSWPLPVLVVAKGEHSRAARGDAAPSSLRYAGSRRRAVIIPIRGVTPPRRHHCDTRGDVAAPSSFRYAGETPPRRAAVVVLAINPARSDTIRYDTMRSLSLPMRRMFGGVLYDADNAADEVIVMEDLRSEYTRLDQFHGSAQVRSS